nr:exopolysaccharide Pel transporter PelG [Lachnospiraceae bacterium]
MAGIGFELNKLFTKKGITAKYKAYGYSGAVCLGPMLLGFIFISIIYMLGRKAGLSKEDHDLI